MPTSWWESHLEQHFRRAFARPGPRAVGHGERAARTVRQHRPRDFPSPAAAAPGCSSRRSASARLRARLRAAQHRQPRAQGGDLHRRLRFHAARRATLADGRPASAANLAAPADLVLVGDGGRPRNPTRPNWCNPAPRGHAGPAGRRPCVGIQGSADRRSSRASAILAAGARRARQRALANVLPYSSWPVRPAPPGPDVPLAARRPLGAGRDHRSLPALARQGVCLAARRVNRAGPADASSGTMRRSSRPYSTTASARRSHPDFGDAWRDWLRLANSLQRHTIAGHRSTVRGPSAVGVGPAVAAAASGTLEPGVASRLGPDARRPRPRRSSRPRVG